jgi:endonuclease/exonuclease/phosphatase family metal-dependent hydrolase
MKEITIATFNCENLFLRFKFGEGISRAKIDNAIKNGFIRDKKLFTIIWEPERSLTASAIKDTGADIIGLQEVESMDTLKSFQSRFIKKYPYQYLVDGNDPRYIDVAVLSKYEAKLMRTHQFDKKGNSKIFSRDCFEIEYDFGGTPLTLFVNHFKSMLDGRAATMNRRKVQSERVVEIIKDKFGNNPAKENFVVLGDLNDYMPSAGLQPLLGQPWLENVVRTRIHNANEQWTHWYDRENSVSQLDYILLSKRISDNSSAVPKIIRKGLPKKATAYTGTRYSGVGNTRPSASDHCPVSIKIKI